MKKLLLSIAVFSIMLLSTQPVNATCAVGGPGATSCSVTIMTLAGGVVHSVTCGTGRYACCNSLPGVGYGAHCLVNGTGAGGGGDEGGSDNNVCEVETDADGGC